MTIDLFYRNALRPALALLPPVMTSDRAEALILAICLQESRLRHRRQIVSGSTNSPARGYAQFERDGSVKGVMTHPKTQAYAEAICATLDVPWERQTIWTALEYHDILACAFARLNLWWDPRALPVQSDPATGWQIYLHTWRPGKPHPETWVWCWGLAWEAVRAMGPVPTTTVTITGPRQITAAAAPPPLPID